MHPTKYPQHIVALKLDIICRAFTTKFGRFLFQMPHYRGTSLREFAAGGLRFLYSYKGIMRGFLQYIEAEWRVLCGKNSNAFVILFCLIFKPEIKLYF